MIFLSLRHYSGRRIQNRGPTAARAAAGIFPMRDRDRPKQNAASGEAAFVDSASVQRAGTSSFERMWTSTSEGSK
jgi:hypothetical protein